MKSNRSLLFRFVAVIVPTLMLAQVTSLIALAADATVADRYSEKPIGITWDTHITQQASMDYMMTIADDHDIKLPWMNNEQIREQMEKFNEAQKGIEKAKAKGSIFYLKKGFIPSFVRVGFRTVIDKAEFKKLVMQRRQMYGGDNERVKLEGNDDRYSLIYKWGDGEGQGISTFFRFTDGVMFDGNFEDVYEMELPTPSYLSLSGVREKYDVLAEFNFKEIPKGYKDIAWSMLSTQTGPLLQQFDEEEDDVYGVRRAAGDLGLNAIKPLIYDIEKADFKLELISDGQPLKFELDLAVRDNSPLSRTLDEVAKGGSRFAGLIDDDAAVTIASTWNLPDGFKDLGMAAANLMRSKIEKETSADEDARNAVRQLVKILEETSKKKKADAILKFGLDRTGEFVFYGGMRLEGTENFVQLLPKLMEHMSDFGASQEQTENGVVYSLQIPESFWAHDVGIPGEVRNYFPGRFNFLFARSAVWFSLGREQSSTKIDDAIKASLERAVNRGNSEQLVFNFDLTEWARGDRDSQPRQALQKVELMFDNMADYSTQQRMRSIRAANNKKKAKDRETQEGAADQEPGSFLFAANDKARSFMEETLATDGFARLNLTTGKKAIRLNGTVGDGLARFVMTRYLTMMTRMMEVSQAQMEKIQAEQKAAVEAAQGASELPAPEGK